LRYRTSVRNTNFCGGCGISFSDQVIPTNQQKRPLQEIQDIQPTRKPRTKSVPHCSTWHQLKSGHICSDIVCKGVEGLRRCKNANLHAKEMHGLANAKKTLQEIFREENANPIIPVTASNITPSSTVSSISPSDPKRSVIDTQIAWKQMKKEEQIAKRIEDIRDMGIFFVKRFPSLFPQTQTGLLHALNVASDTRRRLDSLEKGESIERKFKAQRAEAPVFYEQILPSLNVALNSHTAIPSSNENSPISSPTSNQVPNSAPEMEIISTIEMPKEMETDVKKEMTNEDWAKLLLENYSENDEWTSVLKMSGIN